MKTMKTFKAVIETEINLTEEQALNLLDKVDEYVDYEEFDSIETILLKAFNEIESAVEDWLCEHYDLENNPKMCCKIVDWLQHEWDKPWVVDYFKYIYDKIDEYHIGDYDIFND